MSRHHAQEVQEDALEAVEAEAVSALVAAVPRGARSALPRELRDAEVVERGRRGDVDLFELLMRRYNRTVFRAARAIEGAGAIPRESSPEQHAMHTELQAGIGAAIDELPTEFRIVSVLRAVEQLSIADVAECLGLPAETVKTHLFRARQRLQRRLTSEIEAAAGRVFEFHLVRCDRVVTWVLEQLRRSESGAARGLRVGESH